jgi:hypothetical protein
MKIFLLVLCFLSFGKNQQLTPDELFKRDFDKVAEVYRRNLNLYLPSLIEAQYKPIEKNASKDIVEQRKKIVEIVSITFRDKAKYVTDQCFLAMSENTSATYAIDKRIKIINVIELTFKMEFIGLDYRYFKKAKEESLSFE